MYQTSPRAASSSSTIQSAVLRSAIGLPAYVDRDGSFDILIQHSQPAGPARRTGCRRLADRSGSRCARTCPTPSCSHESGAFRPSRASLNESWSEIVIRTAPRNVHQKGPAPFSTIGDSCHEMSRKGQAPFCSSAVLSVAGLAIALMATTSPRVRAACGHRCHLRRGRRRRCRAEASCLKRAPLCRAASRRSALETAAAGRTPLDGPPGHRVRRRVPAARSRGWRWCRSTPQPERRLPGRSTSGSRAGTIGRQRSCR